jgi:hypothetical protein
VPLAVRPNRPGRCRVLPATFAIAALPARPVRVHGYPPKTNRTIEPFAYSAGIRADVGLDK